MTEASKNFFVVIEGLDGSGKTEVSRRLKRALEQTADVKLTFEPHDPSTGGLYIRQVLTKRIRNVKPRTLALAFALNRADHNDRVIEPYLENKRDRIIICDRYYLSSLVYQSSSEISMEEIMYLNRGVRKPDLIIFLNASTKTCYERMGKRPENKELFEKNLAETRNKYFTAIKRLSDFMLVLDASQKRHINVHYEQDANGSRLSPAIRIFGRNDLAELIFVDTVANFFDEHQRTIRAYPELRNILSDFLDRENLKKYWQNSIKHLSG